MSFTIARVRGIKIRIHFTFLIVFALVTWTLSAHLLPMVLPGLAYAIYLSVAVVGAIILFSSVILHELAHSIMATRYRIKVKQIILFIFGGVSDIEEEPREAINTLAPHCRVHNDINITTHILVYMTEALSTPSFCEVCGVDVSPTTGLKRFGKVFCSLEHMEQYAKARQKGRGEEYDENHGQKGEKKEKGWRRFLREFLRGCC